MTLLHHRPSTALRPLPAAAAAPRVSGRWRTGGRVGVDWVLAATALALAVIGAVLVWSATVEPQRALHADPHAYLYRHCFNIAIGIVLAVCAARVDARVLRFLGPVLYVGSCLALVAVLFIGTTINGAHAWIEIGGGLEVQPAEYAKLGLIAGLAVLFGQRSIGRPPGAPPRNGDVVRALALTVVPLALIMEQPDLGSAMVVGFAVLGLLLAAGVRARWTVGLLILGAVAAVVAVKAGVLAEYQLQRLGSFTHPDADLKGAGYNVLQARIAIAHGGWFGQGLFHGAQTSSGIVPEQQTDFIFSAAAEQFGFIGSTILIALYGVLMWRGLRIAAGADLIGRLICCGVVCWFGFQVFENVGMNLAMTPVTGLPLPFVSYGGSSMFAGALAIGLMQSVRRSQLR